MSTSTPPLLPVHQFLTWTQEFGFWFLLFWVYLPFAMAAYELNQMTARYT